MARIYIFGDESGNFDFSRGKDASRYFVISTVVMGCCDVGSELLDLKRQLHWEGFQLNDYFHATYDNWGVRRRVYDVVSNHDLRVDATLLEKPKTRPHLACSIDRFYQQAWNLHLKHLLPQVSTPNDEVQVVVASIKTSTLRHSAQHALDNVMSQVRGADPYRMAFWPCASDPCLQVADYCCWAIQRKWERGDCEGYDRIARKIFSEFDVFARSTQCYY